MHENLKKLIYTRSYDKDEIIKKLEMLMAINQITASESDEVIDLIAKYPSNKII